MTFCRDETTWMRRLELSVFSLSAFAGPRLAAVTAFVGLVAATAMAQIPVVDLAGVDTQAGRLGRVYGSVGNGSFGVPVAGPGDVDGDGLRDFAVAFMRANPLGRSRAGEVDLIFGDGSIGGTLDTLLNDPRILRIAGDVVQETAGDEIWIADVTGDGLADLLIGRQNYTPDGDRIGSGALSIVVGGGEVRQFALRRETLDLRAPQSPVRVFTLVGRQAGDRLGIWMRTGDVDGDGVQDILVGADGEDQSGASNSGAVYLIRGGPHLAAGGVVDLAGPSPGPLDGNLARLHPPAGSGGFHVGATCNLLDLDGNGRSEVLAAAALNRSGAAIPPQGGTAQATGGSPHGTLYIAWDDNFPEQSWPAGFDLDLSQPPGSSSVVSGGVENGIFGEEIVGGMDYDSDGTADLFIGDFLADSSPGQNRRLSGTGYVFYGAGQLKGLQFTLDSLPPELRLTRILGPSAGSIGADTAAQGDFNGDGVGDLLFGSPHDRPQGRLSAGSIHVIYGRAGGWPEVIDLATPPAPAVVRISHIQGAHGSAGTDSGDTLCYSAAAGDVDIDGFDDILTNEMLGNGTLPGAEDVGNLILVSGRFLAGQATPRNGSAVFAAGVRQDDDPAALGSAEATTFRVSNVLAAPGGLLFQGLDLTGDPQAGRLEFYLFGNDGNQFVYTTDMNPALGSGLDDEGRLLPGGTYTVGLGEILDFLGTPRRFEGYVWVIANFSGVAGSYSVARPGDSSSLRSFVFRPAVGESRSGTAGIPVSLP